MKYRNSISYKIFIIFNSLFMLAIILVTVLPYLNVLAKALNDGYDTMLGGITFWPRKLTFENFRLLLNDSTIYKASFISLSRVILGVTLGIAVQFTAGYALTKKDFPGKVGIMIFFIIPMFFSGGLIPLYVLYSKVKLINGFWVYILPSLFVFYHVLIIKSYINATIPTSLEESARLDGLSEFGILIKIILPLSKPILATVALWIAVAHWNDWVTTLYFVNKENLFTLQYKLMQLIKESERMQKMLMEAVQRGEGANVMSENNSTPEALISAQVILTTIPIIMVYPFLQKYFIQGIVLGAIKE